MKKFKQASSLELHVMETTRRVQFFAEVASYAIRDTKNLLTYLSELGKAPITLEICSPGGSVDYGLVLYDFIKSSKVPIYTHCTGMAASMGAVLLAAGKKGYRSASKNSRIMIHQPSSGYIGKASDIEIHANETKRIRKLLNQIIANDTGKPLARVSKDTELDYWMTAEEAKEYGLIDRIV
jgi:ATP-dependent Clp protease protease subunit